MNSPTSDAEADRKIYLSLKVTAVRVDLPRFQNERRRDLFRMALSATAAAFLFFSGLYAKTAIAMWLSAIPFLFAAYLVTYVIKLSRHIEDLRQELARLETERGMAPA